MPTPTIPAGNLYMNATLFTGTGASLTVTNGSAGQSFQPDFVWLKTRNQSGYGHELFDSVRGVGNYLISNSTNAESAQATSLTAFNSNGFSVGSWGFINGSGDSIVGWNWKAGGTAVSNTDGTITSQVSANTTSGFSVVTFTAGSGASPSYITVGHGLGVAPAMVINKRINGTSGWLVYHSSLATPATQWLELNNTSAVQTASPFWGASGMTSTTLGFSDNVVVNGQTYVNYCFAPIAGYSAFGSYTGNGSADGPFIYTGFRPRWLMTKRIDSSSSGDWNLVDTSRNPSNVVGYYLYANQSATEGSAAIYDLLSNGFKIRESGAGTNANGSTYVYAAFAENPFKYANAR